MGSDYTLFAKIDGTVKYETYVRKRKIQKRVHILPFELPLPNSSQKRRFFKGRGRQASSFWCMRRPQKAEGAFPQRQPSRFASPKDGPAPPSPLLFYSTERRFPPPMRLCKLKEIR